jgi:predicted O-methyltransferase YrrM
MVKKIYNFFKKKAFNFFSISEEVQNNLFKSNDLNRDSAIKKINEIINNSLNEYYNEENGMFSEHLVIFAAISLCNKKISSILEIGTYDGKTSVILSKLFPHAFITTIDLPYIEKKFYKTYRREENVLEFINKRSQLITSCDNIKFLEINSLKLSEFTQNFDLIWVDGDHSYPVVAMDLINSFRLLRKGGLLLIDDIFKSSRNLDNYYESLGGLSSLYALKDANLIGKFTLFYKRLGGKFNINKQFIGYFEK